MSIAKTNLDCFRGDTTHFTIHVLGEDGLPLSLTGAKVWMTATRSSRGVRVFQRTSLEDGGITLDADQVANPGKAVIKLAPTSTSDLEGSIVTLYYDIQVLTSGGDLYTVQYGDLVVTPDATQETV